MTTPARGPSGRGAPAAIDDQAWSVVRAVAAHGLPGAPPIPSVDDPEVWPRIVRLAEQQRVLGLLVATLDPATVEGHGPSAPALVVTDDARQEIAASHEAWCGHDLRLERALGQAADALDAAGIAYLVTKGPALAHRAYPDPSRRLFADLDLIVPSGQVRRSTETLALALDAAVVMGELRPGFDERFGKETLLRTAVTDATPVGLEIDLHRTPVAGALGLAIDLDDLFRAPDELVLGLRRMPTPEPATSVVLAAYQASVADIPPRLGARRDLVQLCLGQCPPAHPSSRPEAAAVIAVARRWRARAVLATAVVEAWAELDLPQPDPEHTLATELLNWARSYRPSVGEQLVLASHRRPGYVYWRQLAGVAMVSGTRDRVGYLRALLWPQPGYLADRSWSIGRHLRRAVRTLDAPIRHRVVGWSRRVARRSGLRP